MCVCVYVCTCTFSYIRNIKLVWRRHTSVLLDLFVALLTYADDTGKQDG